MNKQKIIVSTLALAMGAALAGSVSGTVAWFQYSTRAQASYIGSSAHCSEALEIKAVGDKSGSEETDWKTELAAADIAGVLSATNGNKLEPITSGAMDQNVALNKIGGDGANKNDPRFYKNPVYQYEDPTVWGLADKTNYVQFKLEFHVKDIDGASTAAYLDGHNLYLTNLEIVSLANEDGTATSDLDLKKAVRVHISDGDSYNALFALGAGSDSTLTTVTHGNLDLNNDNALDQTAGYEWTSGRTTLDYGNPTHAASPAGQVAYDTAKTTNFASDTNPSTVSSTTVAPGLIGSIAKAEVGITLTVTMWLEGWANLSNKPANNATTGSAVWDPATYVGEHFGVGFRFATELHEAHA